MSKRTTNYNFYTLEEGDIWYPDLDKANMQTVENQLSALTDFVGPGVTSGWDITKVISETASIDAAYLVERLALINADADTDPDLYEQCQMIGDPHALIDPLTADNSPEIWNRVVRVTLGEGIVGVYRARTDGAAYILLPDQEGEYNIWAVPTLCLASEGLAAIAVSSTEDGDFGDVYSATFLGKVQVSNVGGYNQIVLIDTSKRQNLQNLSGAFQKALRKYFYSHVHSGETGSPSQIKLDTDLILDAPIPTDFPGTTIFLVKNADNTNFLWESEKYGVPKVLLNNIELSKDTYVIEASKAEGKTRIYLKNSLPENSILQLILPLSPQKTLYPIDIQDTPIKLTLTLGNTKVFDWTSSEYATPEVYLRGQLVDSGDGVSTGYQIDASLGQIKFLPALPDASPGEPYTEEDLTVVITSLGKEIEDVLSGKRTQNVNASSFTRGTLTQSRIPAIDHVGAVRFQEKAKLNPTLRLFGEDDHITYFPEIDSPMQYGTDIRIIHYSSSIGLYLIGTKRGLMSTLDFIDFEMVSSWTPDMGIPIQIIDNELPTGEIYFSATYIVTAEGKIYYTKDSASSWQLLKLPKVNLSSSVIVTPKASCFWISTDSIYNESTRSYDYSTYMYLGTEDQGVFKAIIQENQRDKEWQWTRISLPDFVTTVNSIVEIATLKTVINKQNGDILDAFERSTYIAAKEGFYVSHKNGEFFTVPDFADVQGLLWIRTGLAQNNIMWRTANDVFITHTGKHQTLDSSSTYTDWYDHPLDDAYKYITVDLISNSSDSYILVQPVADGNVLLQNNPTFNGVVPQVGDVVLFKEEGFNYGACTCTRIDPDGSTADFTQIASNPLYCVVEQNGIWISDAANSSDLLVEQIICNSTPLSLCSLVDTSEYWVSLTNGMISILDRQDEDDNWLSPVVSSMSWSITQQSQAVTCWDDSSNTCIGTIKGLWITKDSGANWERHHKEFATVDSAGDILPTITIYDALLGEKIADGWTADEFTQSIVFDETNNSWDNYVYEKDYVDYYVSPWDQTSDILVYEDGELTSTAYTISPTDGRITFAESKNSDTVIQITIIKQGAFISNAGKTPHEELPNILVVSDTPATVLAKQLEPNDTVIILKDSNAIPTTTEYIELRYENLSERIRINANRNSDAITISGPRTNNTNTSFPADSTEIYLVSLATVKGIEDEISLLTSNQTYHFNSLTALNAMQVALAAQEGYDGLFENYIEPLPGVPSTGSAYILWNRMLTPVRRYTPSLKTVVSGFDAGEIIPPSVVNNWGPENALFVDLQDETQLDTTVSSATTYIGVQPNVNDSAIQPHTMYIINTLAADGTNMRIGTDQGIWAYNATNAQWFKEKSYIAQKSTDIKRVYFLKTINEKLVAGTDKGVFNNIGAEWHADTTFSQATFDYLESNWFGDSCSVWAKEDGIAFIKQNQNDTDFTSDSFGPLDGINVYGLWKGYFFVENKASGEKDEVDAVYLCTEKGLYGITEGSRGGEYSNFLDGREMFGPNQLMKTVVLPDGTASSVPVKFYKIFQSPRPKSVPLIILSNDGIIVVRNWRWANPTIKTEDYQWVAESRSLRGLSCYCYATTTATESTPNGDATVYKMFVGTNKGVYRSYNEGYAWEKCERINNNDLAIFDLQTIDISDTTYLVAATDNGIFFSSDDGDTWTQPSSQAAISFNKDITSAINFTNSQYYAQTFTLPNIASTMIKISLYVDVASSKYPSNQLIVNLYNDNGSGAPDLSSNFASLTLNASDIAVPGMKSIILPANTTFNGGEICWIVMNESVEPGGEPVFRCYMSEQESPYQDGYAYTSLDLSTWTQVISKDFYFKVYYELPALPTTNLPESIDFSNGDSIRGCIIDESDNLTTDIKIALLLVVDDTVSMEQAISASNKKTNIQELVDSLFERTYKYNAVTFTAVDGTLSLADGNEHGFTDHEQIGFIGSPMYAGIQEETAYYAILIDNYKFKVASSAKSDTPIEITATGEIQWNVSVFKYSDRQSYLDLWRYADDIETLTNGFTNDLSDIHIHIASLNNKGQDSDLYNASEQSITGLNYQSLLDATTSKTTEWAKGFVPIIIVVSDGDITGGNALNAVVSAISTWDDDGVPIFCFGTGHSHNQKSLRSLANSSGGKHFYLTI